MDFLDIVQGDLGSCYFVCSLFGLFSRDCKVERIKKLFLADQYNSSGVYGVKLLKQGQYKNVVVDDYFPCFNKKKLPAFSVCKDTELWVLIIEKCWAKLNGSCYMKIWLGTPQEALAALSEAPCFYEFHKKYIERTGTHVLWKKIKEAEDKKWIMCSNTEEVPDAKKYGLAEFHAYSIIQIYDLGELKLIKMRNPWANNTWKGEYNYKSDLWTDKLKKAVNYNEVFKFHKNKNELIKENGIFFITFQDYTKYFSWTFICKHDDLYKYNYAKFRFPARTDKELDQSLKSSDIVTAFIEIKKKTKCYISLHQSPKRYSYDLKNFTLPLGMIIIANFDSGNYYFIDAEFINWERLVVEQELEPGEYHIFAKSYWKYPEIKHNIVISIYSTEYIDIYQMNKAEIPDIWYKKIMIDLVVKKGKKKKLADGIFLKYSMHEITNNTTGLGIFYIENKLEVNVTVIVVFNEFKGVRILDCNLNAKGDMYADVPPNGTRAIHIQYIDLPWNCSVKFTQVYRMDYTSDQVIEKFLDADTTTTIELENKFVFYKIPYDYGCIIYLVNNSENIYEGTIQIKSLKNARNVNSDGRDIVINFNLNKNGKIIKQYKIIDIFESYVIDINKNNINYKKISTL